MATATENHSRDTTPPTEHHKGFHPVHIDPSPLSHARSNNELRLAAFGGEYQPGLYRPPPRKIANPAPLGLSCFGLTTFILSLINIGARGVHHPNIVVAVAYAYGGLVQLLSGMWEFAAGNTFGATALSSYGGFWISFGIILTPGGFEIVEGLEAKGVDQFYNSFGFFLTAWIIFTTMLLILTLRSTLAFFMLFFTLDIAFCCLAAGYFNFDEAGPNATCIKVGGWFGVIAAFLAWYNAFAGMADDTNSFFVAPVMHFPWSEKAKERNAQATADLENGVHGTKSD
ncbi:uncharacterized protein BDR25DRAFT_326420 [Lindgomyces ingoldianus]|uniref:Uncharacterized protein n=1 Tax=Lindgomyces ingoldianus TaxID=673940 RepID=A0ACB6QSX7_9PLEO|nr:uncharacterized protein BDR25DRAFT_326420 [Lindgomyces ingoldianus]KAF2469205.1 hypothetical protein BDR25DRAFT_326420 [Lindgomyces ingoldianus]